MRRLVVAVALAAGMLVVGACGGGSGKPAATGTGHTVLVRALSFDPETVQIKTGETVTWKWADSSGHNVTFPSFHSKTKTGGTYAHTFTTPGTFDYKCTIHPTMTGKVVVTAA